MSSTDQISALRVRSFSKSIRSAQVGGSDRSQRSLPARKIVQHPLKLTSFLFQHPEGNEITPEI